MSMFSKGDLAWLPSNSTLVQLDEKEDDSLISSSDYVIKKWKITNKPKHVVVLSEYNETYFQIMCDGKEWYTERQSLYKV